MKIGTGLPGWRWSEHVQPIARTDSCQAAHTGYFVSGRMKVVMDDGEEMEYGPGDYAVMAPGHDAWIVGDEPCIVINWQGYADYAKRVFLPVERLTEGALSYFRAVAADFDGTLAEGHGRPDTLAALAEARARGIRVILVTGRIMSELRAVFPDVEDHVDAVVAENGALVAAPAGVRLLAAPIDRAVSAALAARGVAHRNGQVLVACAAADEPAALEVIRGLGLDCQLVRNRAELMILPAGVTKGSGLLEALGRPGPFAPQHDRRRRRRERPQPAGCLRDRGGRRQRGRRHPRARRCGAGFAGRPGGGRACSGDRCSPGEPTPIPAAGRSRWAPTTAARR